MDAENFSALLAICEWFFSIHVYAKIFLYDWDNHEALLVMVVGDKTMGSKNLAKLDKLMLISQSFVCQFM